MSYQIYATKSTVVFVITKDERGVAAARAQEGEELGELRLWKTVETMDKAIGADSVTDIDRSIAAHGFHVQRSGVQVKEN